MEEALIKDTGISKQLRKKNKNTPICLKEKLICFFKDISQEKFTCKNILKAVA
jgi:hypothetical protein